MEQLRIISISDIHEMLTENLSASNKLYLSHGIGIANGINSIFKNIAKSKEPFVVDEPRFIFVTKGALRVNINLIDYQLQQGMIGYVSSGSIVNFGCIDEQSAYDGFGMIISDDILRIALHGNMPQSLNGTETNFFVIATDQEQGMIREMINALWTVEHQEREYTASRNALIAAIVYAISDIRANSIGQSENNRTREREIFDRFIALVNKHSAKEHHLPFYADCLCLSEKYLSSVIRKASGNTAKQWIDRSLISAAKVKLLHTDLQITQIADQLNFANTSFFCKYFKKQVGISPNEYRLQ